MKTILVACLATALVASAARADFATGGSIAIDVTPPNTSVLAAGNIGAIDGAYFLTVDGTGGPADAITFDTTWAAGSTAPRFEIAVGALSGTVEITSITLSDGLDFFAYTPAVAFALTGNTVNVVDVNLNDTVNGFFFGNYTGYSVASFTVAFTAGSSFQIDAIANPEPGTWALFGLGAVGLGVWGRRRRRLQAARGTAPGGPATS